MQNLWNLEEQMLLERLKKDILSGPILERPDTYRRFYIKTYWSKDVMGVELLQSDVSEEARKSETQKRPAESVNFTSPYKECV